ncbi:ABC transporter permease [Roseivirga sp. BDSF3-8]|uniref:ABC transporter permease n=1 Tax=Roseivirga sp. BDSF3-8 TaxID=3241598 RepID=UPI00353212B2
MLRYLLRRLLWAIPAVLAVALLVLLIGELAPQDWVAGRLEGTAGRFSDKNTAEMRQTVYRRIRSQYGLDLPIFYVSITSLAEPDTLRSLYPSALRELAGRVVYNYGNWEPAANYTSLVMEAETATLNNPDVASLIGPLYKWHDVSTAKRQWMALAEFPGITTKTRSLTRQALVTLDNLERTATPWKNFIPKIRWHGINNRYHLWLTSLIKGDFGTSFRDGEAVNDKISTAVSQTLWVTIPALFMTFLLSLWLGKFLSQNSFSIPANLSSTALYMLDAMPLFWLCLLFIMALVTLDLYELLPFYDVISVPSSGPQQVFTKLRQLIFPISCLALSSIPYVTKQVESAFKEVYPKEYITTARAKGLSESKVTWKHAFRNAIFPLITLISLFLPAVFAGSLVVEALFAIPGIGKLLTDSVIARDFPVVMGIVFYIALIRIGANILADIAYFASDPRIRLRE